MRKYFALIKTGFKNALVYRSDFFFWGINELLDTLIFLFIWIVIYGDKNAIGGFSLSETVTYLIGVGLISNIISSWMSYDIESDIKSGWLSNLLIKPISYPKSRFSFGLSGKPVNLLIRLAVYILVAIFFRSKIIVTVDFVSWFLTIISVMLAFVINSLFDFSVGCISFWTVTTRGSSNIIRTINSIFSGSYAPIVFFPRWFQTTAFFLPFMYTRYFPMLIYLKKISNIEAIKGIGIQLFWIFLLFLISRLVWRKGIKRYEGVGI